MTSSKAIHQYLTRYAEPETELLSNFPRDLQFQRSLVIPVYDESIEFFERLRLSTLSSNLLLILVINRPDSIEQCAANEALLQHFEELPLLAWGHKNLKLRLNNERNLGVLLIDRHSNPIPAKQGVGLARKIGCDLAASLIDKNVIQSNWIHSTDADAHLPSDYFCAESLDITYAAATYAFHHQHSNNPIAKATALYEQTLHDYVDGLKLANSPYAFHTIGSVLAFTHQSYCQARGFPKRSGGEDFYLLNKLRKLGKVAALDSKILLQSRVSHRVPFGTGPATAKILEQLESGSVISTYNPEIFQRLKQWLWKISDAIENDLELRPILDQLPADTQDAIKSLDIDACFKHLKQHKTAAQKLRHFHDWMDAFRTLKFVRHMQTHYLHNIPLGPVNTNFVLPVASKNTSISNSRRFRRGARSEFSGPKRSTSNNE